MGGDGWWVAKLVGFHQKNHRVISVKTQKNRLVLWGALDGFDVVKCVENHCPQSRDNWKHAQCMYLLMKHIFERFPTQNA